MNLDQHLPLTAQMLSQSNQVIVLMATVVVRCLVALMVLLQRVPALLEGINLSSAAKGSSSISGPAPAERTASSSSSTSTSGGSNVDSVNLGQNINVGLSGAGGGGSIPVLTQAFGGSQNVLNLAQIVDQLTITITQTTTIDRFVTVTDTILNSVPITLTGFKVNTVTLTTVGVRQTDVDDLIQIATTVVERPVTEVVTTAKSNFVYVTVVSSDLYTITHNAYLISQTTHTTVVTETITMASPVIRTTILTSVQISTEIHTVVNTIYVPGYNY
ncbi:uncharacterized protein [Macrobrachium rosenbergii]|uniref:uncharacterized protein n=1 Tax=Macrobrachium rosenbergii TaxID=79674 RepID=UPI0034D519B0